MKIVYESRFLVSPSKGGGISRDSQNIYQKLTMTDSTEVIKNCVNKGKIFANMNNNSFNKIKTLFNIQKDLKIQCDVFWDSQLSGFHSTLAKYHVVRIHDLFPITNPEWFTKMSQIVFRNNLKHAIKRNSFFVVNSEQTKQELIRTQGVDEKNLFILECDFSLAKIDLCDECQGCALLGLNTLKSFNLMVGTIEPRKNYELLVSLYKEYGIKTSTLIIGRDGWKNKRIIRDIEMTPNLYWISGCCDGALRQYYERAKTFASLSKNEGFNIAAREAQQFNLPRVLSDIEVHRSIHFGAEFIPLDDKRKWAEVFSNDKKQMPDVEVTRKNLTEENLSDFLERLNYA